MGRNRNSLSFQLGSGIGKVAVVWLFCPSDLSAFFPISGSEILFSRLVRTCTTRNNPLAIEFLNLEEFENKQHRPY